MKWQNCDGTNETQRNFKIFLHLLPLTALDNVMGLHEEKRNIKKGGWNENTYRKLLLH